MYDLNAAILPITVDYCNVQSGLPLIHGDPFDRLIISQALFDRVSVVSSDGIFDPYGVTRIW